jgi:hypothetical protein
MNRIVGSRALRYLDSPDLAIRPAPSAAPLRRLAVRALMAYQAALDANLPRQDVELDAIEALLAIGSEINRDIVHLNGRIYCLVIDANSAVPTIVVAPSRVYDLD